jgi:hypothetical protein
MAVMTMVRRRCGRATTPAFALDPDGHRIEAVCHAPEQPDEA